MKKLTCIFIVITMLVSLASCSKSKNNEEEKKTDYYSDTVFSELKSFTEITGIEIKNSVDNDIMCSTDYTYSVNNDTIDETVSEYEAYLEDYGFAKTVSETADTVDFTIDSNDEKLTITTKKSEITISLPYDEAKKSSRYDVYYNEIIDACNSENYEKVYELYESYYFLAGYRGYNSCILFADGMSAYNEGDYYNSALKLLQASECDELKEISKRYLNEITKYDGVYYHAFVSSGQRLGTYYWFISMGAASFELDFTSNSYGSYDYGDPTNYQMALITIPNEDGSSTLYSTVPSLLEFGINSPIYKFEFNSDSDLIVTNVSGVDTYDTFAGVFTKGNNPVPVTRVDTIS